LSLRHIVATIAFSAVAGVFVGLAASGRVVYDYLIPAVVAGLAVMVAFSYALRARPLPETPEAGPSPLEGQDHDPVTLLPGRQSLFRRLNEAVEEAGREGLAAVLFLRLDRLKLINDTFGEAVGDNLLRAVAERLQSTLRKTDMVARPGGNEFTAVLPGLHTEGDAAVVAEKVLSAMKTAFYIEGKEMFLNTAIGIGIYPACGRDAVTLIKNAYTAMGHAGENAYRVYSPSLQVEGLRRMTMENGLRKAVERKEFVLHYQPQIDLVTGLITGMEALIRWRSPDFGLLQPNDFIPISEESGLIIPIGEWVLKTACRQNRAWQEAGLRSIRMAVNISARQFREAGLLEAVKRALDEAGMDPHFLELELTESIVLQPDERALGTLSSLKELGVLISIDDFGTGYSSLSYLKNFPVGKLKIVGSFVASLAMDPTDSAIANAIISMARALSLRTIAEGVETEEQLKALRALGCAEAQGYLFSRPLPAKEAEALLAEDRRWAV